MTADVISGFKLVWDMLSALISGYESKRRELFVSHIDPLHERMVMIHKDYLRGFGEVKKYLESGETPPSAVIGFLEERRRDYALERELAEELAKALKSMDEQCVGDETWASLRAFCNAIVDYLSASANVGGISWYSDFVGELKRRTNSGLPNVWDPAGIAGNPRAYLLGNVRILLNRDLPEAFSPISVQYAKLRTRLL